MTKNEVIAAKLLKTWPHSWELFERSTKYSIEHGLNWIKGILSFNEKSIPYEDAKAVQEELLSYLESLGYKNVSVSHKDHFFSKEGTDTGTIFVVFLSTAAMNQFLEERERWNKWAKTSNYRYSDSEPKQPIYNAIRYLNIDK